MRFTEPQKVLAFLGTIAVLGYMACYLATLKPAPSVPVIALEAPRVVKAPGVKETPPLKPVQNPSAVLPKVDVPVVALEVPPIVETPQQETEEPELLRQPDKAPPTEAPSVVVKHKKTPPPPPVIMETPPVVAQQAALPWLNGSPYSPPPRPAPWSNGSPWSLTPEQVRVKNIER